MTIYRFIPDTCADSSLSFKVQILEGEFEYVQVKLFNFDFSTLEDLDYFRYDKQLFLSEDKTFSEEENIRLNAIIDEIVADIVHEAIRKCAEDYGC